MKYLQYRAGFSLRGSTSLPSWTCLTTKLQYLTGISCQTGQRVFDPEDYSQHLNDVSTSFKASKTTSIVTCI